MSWSGSLMQGAHLAHRIAEEVLENPSAYRLPKITSTEMVAGGVAHYVYRLNTSQERFYLKIRGACFPSIPEIRTNPSDIAYEHKALTMLGSLLPDHFPKVVFFDPQRALMILTDALPDGNTLEDLLHEKKATPAILKNIGTTLRKIHDSSNSIPGSIREDGDNEFFAIKLQHRFRYRSNPILNDLVDELTNRQPRQIIIGDPAPKNIGVNSGGERLIFFDLEDVHRGNVVSDVGYIAGHLILNAHSSAQRAAVALESFLRGYDDRDLDGRLVKGIALGTMMYRLDSIIPYSIGLSREDELTLLVAVEEALSDHDLSLVSWWDLINSILRV